MTTKFYSVAPTENKTVPDYSPEAIAKQVAEFEKRGGKVQQLAPGHSNVVPSLSINSGSKPKRNPERSRIVFEDL